MDDTEEVRRLAVEALREVGYEVLEASDGPAALKVAGDRKGPIDLLLTDYVMPGMSGLALARAMQPQRPGMKVLYVSGFVEKEDVQSGVLEGVFKEGAAFLQKPFKQAEVVRKVRAVLHGV